MNVQSDAPPDVLHRSTSTARVDVCFSVNVHESPGFVAKQLQNIREFVPLDYVVIINANERMYEALAESRSIQSDVRVVLNENWLNKKRYHGSLTHGICLNMNEALRKYTFKYFVILSSRNMFYNELTRDKLEHQLPLISPYGWGRNGRVGVKFADLNTQEWHWHSFVQTKLGQFLIEHDRLFSSSAHEGLCFDHASCEKMIAFLDAHPAIKEDLFTWNHCVEEFALQSLCVNATGAYHYLGNGCKTHHDLEKLPADRFLYKTDRI